MELSEENRKFQSSRDDSITFEMPCMSPYETKESAKKEKKSFITAEDKENVHENILASNSKNIYGRKKFSASIVNFCLPAWDFFSTPVVFFSTLIPSEYLHSVYLNY